MKLSSKTRLSFLVLILLVGAVGVYATTISPSGVYDTPWGNFTVGVKTPSITLNGTTRTSWWGALNPFDQYLNSTDNVSFGSVNVTGDYYLNSVNITDVLYTSQGATATVGFNEGLDYLPNYWYCDGVADNVQIQAAIDYVYLGARDGGKVYIQEGLYSISSTITIYGNLIIDGAGQQSTKLILADNADCNMFEYVGADNYLWFHMYHMLLDGNKDNNVAGNGVYINAAGQFQDAMFWNVFIARFSEDGLYTNQGWGLRLIDFLAEFNEGHGVYIGGGSRPQIISCKIRDNDKNGINCRAGGAIITGNDIGTSGWGGLLLGGGADEGVITGNTFVENTGHHISVSTGCDDYVITSNIFDGAGVTNRGVKVDAVGNRNLISNNQFMDHVIVSVLDDGADTKINNNVGFITENIGSATILNGTTNITIAHGLDYTPSSANTAWTVSYLELPTNDPGSWYIDGFNATSAIIHVLRDPGVSNLDISWSARRTP